jgi:predicted enzyme related to lactoylglutathione lyase
MNRIKFAMPVIIVNDIAISKKFYQNIFSLEIENDFGENVVFKDSFSIWEKEKAKEIIFGAIRDHHLDDRGDRFVELFFRSSELEAISEKLKIQNVELIHDIKEETWGQRTIRFFDPDKYIIEVAEPIDDVIFRLSKTKSIEQISVKTQLPIEYVKKVLHNS